ncbi:MAG TPA: zinc ribbon domain-containing protein [Ktedonobacteraceae bacterium]|nr:zinc ribbon domain-containing protein [Ktedonobacteraceae bacterium]
MDVLLRDGVALWIAVAVMCIVLGLVLTVVKWLRQKSSSRAKPLVRAKPVSRSVRISSRLCPACGQPGDHQARFCGACGSSLGIFSAQTRRRVGATTVLVDERALEQECSQQRRTHWP